MCSLRSTSSYYTKELVNTATWGPHQQLYLPFVIQWASQHLYYDVRVFLISMKHCDSGLLGTK